MLDHQNTSPHSQASRPIVLVLKRQAAFKTVEDLAVSVLE